MPIIKDRDDLVVYTRTSTNKLWELFRKKKKNVIEAYYSNLTQSDIDYDALGDSLIDLGNQERQKEINLIRLYFPTVTTEIDEANFIKNFNEIMQGKDNFINAIQRLKNAVSKDTVTNSTKGQLAPFITSIMSQKFGTYIAEEVQKRFKPGADVQKVIDNWDAEQDEICNRAIERAMDDLFINFNKSNDDGLFGRQGEYDELYSLWQQVENKQEFYNLVKATIGVDNLRNLIRNLVAPYKNQRPPKLTKESIHKLLHTKSQAGQIGGKLAEYITALIQNNIQPEGGPKRSSAQIRGEMSKTDSATIISTNINVDTGEILDIVQTAISEQQGPQSLAATARSLEQAQSRLANLSDTFIVYTSQKMYGMGKSFRGFETGNNTPIKELSAIGESVHADLDEINGLIYSAYNIIPGAILADRRNKVQELVKAQIAKWFAYVLFDDWVSIGATESATQSIHVMNLDGINIPLSILLQGLGKLLKDEQQVKTILHVSLTTPDEVLYPTEEDISRYPIINKNGRIVPDTSMAWAIQAQEAANKVQFSTTILINFKSLIRSKIDLLS